MAGIVFPDFARSFGAGQALRQQEQQNAFQMDRARREDEIYAREQEAAQHVPGALSGDRDALGKVATLSPKTAMSIVPLLERMDTNQRARLKEQFEATGKAAAGILALPEADQPAAYEATYQALTQQGYKINLPPKWSPALKGQLQSYAVQVPEYLKMLGDQPQPMGGVPAPAGGGVSSNNIGNVRPNGQSVGFQQPATLEDGIRLAVNNVKAYPKAFNGGQPMSLVQIGERWAPRGDGANDPLQWAKNVASIGGLDPTAPLDFNDPMTAAKFARGLHGAEHGAGKVMPVEAYAQALTQGGATGPGPQVAQGDNTRADGSGNPLPPQAPQQEVFEINAWLSKAMPGAKPMGVRGKPVRDSQGLLMILKPDGTTGWVEVPKPQQPPSGYQPNPAGGLQPIPGGPADKKTGGPFAGTGMDAQSMNILLTGDPASPEYALAFSHLSKPRTTIDDQGRPVTIQPMDLSAVRKPAAVAGAPAASSGGTTTALPGGGQVTVGEPVAPKGPGAAEMAKLRNARAEAEKITVAANDFKTEWAKASPVDRARALAGANTPLNAAYNNFALLAKGDALFQLGVLNGPDLEIIRRTIPDPSTGKSIMTTENDVTSSVDKVLNILNTGISATEKQLGIAPPAAPQTPENGGDKRLSPEEAAKLPPGSTFIGTDGVKRVRR